MAANEYHFISRWRVRCTVAQAAEILGEPLKLPRWWPAVYLDVRELRPGDQNGVGRDVDLWTKGWLPYTLRWQFTVTEVRPDGFSLRARGDFDGRGIWSFAQAGDCVDITYDWKLVAGKPLLRRLSWLLKPVFAANHRWAMAKGEESLRLELARRHATTAADRAAVPPPPGPTRLPAVPVAGVALAGVGLLMLVLLKQRPGSTSRVRPLFLASHDQPQ